MITGSPAGFLKKNSGNVILSLILLCRAHPDRKQICEVALGRRNG
jgi:hypothetical protein